MEILAAFLLVAVGLLLGIGVPFFLIGAVAGGREASSQWLWLAALGYLGALLAWIYVPRTPGAPAHGSLWVVIGLAAIFLGMVGAGAIWTADDQGGSPGAPMALDAPRYTAEQVWAATGSSWHCLPRSVEYRGNGFWYCVYPWVFDERSGRLFEHFSRED